MKRQSRAIFVLSWRRIYIILGLSFFLMGAAVCVGLWGLHRKAQTWTFPVSMLLLHLPAPLPVGIVFGLACGAVAIKPKPKR